MLPLPPLTLLRPLNSRLCRCTTSLTRTTLTRATCPRAAPSTTTTRAGIRCVPWLPFLNLFRHLPTTTPPCPPALFRFPFQTSTSYPCPAHRHCVPRLEGRVPRRSRRADCYDACAIVNGVARSSQALKASNLLQARLKPFFLHIVCRVPQAERRLRSRKLRRRQVYYYPPSLSDENSDPQTVCVLRDLA